MTTETLEGPCRVANLEAGDLVGYRGDWVPIYRLTRLPATEKTPPGTYLITLDVPLGPTKLMPGLRGRLTSHRPRVRLFRPQGHIITIRRAVEKAPEPHRKSTPPRARRRGRR